jgi:hypothetical protein
MRAAMSRGAWNTPAPMIEPITIIVQSNRPSVRRSFASAVEAGLDSSSGAGLIVSAG